MLALINRAGRKRWLTCKPLQTSSLFAALLFYPLSKHLTLIHVLGVRVHVLSCLFRFTAVLVLWKYFSESWWVCLQMTRGSNLYKPVRHVWTCFYWHGGILQCLQQPVEGQRQQQQKNSMQWKLIKDLFGFAIYVWLLLWCPEWRGWFLKFHLLIFFPADWGTSLLLFRPCERCHLLIII